MKIGPVDPEIICLKGLFEKKKRGVYTCQFLKLQSYFTKSHQIFTRCSQAIPIEPFHMGIAIFHFVLECQGDMNVSRPISPILTIKLVAIDRSEKGQIYHLRQNTYHMVKI